MITRKKLEEFRSSRRELAEIRAEIKKAELEGSWTRNGYRIAMYEAIAAEREDELERIEIEINHLESADHRRVLRMRYIDGMSIKAAARKMHYSERQMKRILAKAINMIEDAGEMEE